MTASGESAARRAMAALGHVVGVITWRAGRSDGTLRVSAPIAPPVEVRPAPGEAGVFHSAVAEVPRGGDDAVAVDARIAELVRQRADLAAERAAFWRAEHRRAQDAVALLDDGAERAPEGPICASADPDESGRRLVALGLGVDAYCEAATLARALVELRAMKANVDRDAAAPDAARPVRSAAREVDSRVRTIELSFGDRLAALRMDPGSSAEDAARLWRALNRASSLARST